MDAYRFIGFRPLEQLEGVFGDPKARVITLVRRSKKQTVVRVVACTGTTALAGECGIFPVAVAESIWSSRSGGSIAGVARR